MDPNSTGILSQIQSIIAPAVLVPVHHGEKRPLIAGWQKLTLNDMTDEYVAKLDPEQNIGVLLGGASEGLCTIDIDDEKHVVPFLVLNPKLANTLQTKGHRGRNFWVRVTGNCPTLGKLTDAATLENIGEWRADGGQTIIWGTHPSGDKYQWLVNAKPVELEFSEIAWPSNWILPWAVAPEDALVRDHGKPYTLGARGAVALNPGFFAAKFAHEHLTIWEPDERAFYQYADDLGLWRRTSAETIKLQLSEDIKAFADQIGFPALVNRRSNALLSDWTELLKGHVEKANAFGQKKQTIHLKNGMLNLATSPPELMPFSPDFFSRNICPFEFKADAVCPLFKKELLGKALNQDDISLLQRWCGSVLLSRNAAQKIMLLCGTAGGGKSTLLEILERIIGVENVIELRADLLFERFELARFVGKTLLSGKDVPGDFLSHKGANALKKLVGHDLLSAELKRANEPVMIRGDFSVVCTCNSRLRVRLDADVEAWRRRLLLIDYSLPKPEKPIRDFATQLVETEGAGILRWMIEGAVLHLAELTEHGDYRLSEKQLQRIDDLLNESDSVRHFVQERVTKDDESTVTTDELVEAYCDYCDDKGWRSEGRRTVENQLPDHMLQIHRLNRRNDIERGSSTRKGYKGVRLCPSNDPF